MRASWDIFCSVVDNYGDIGVTWRLARQLCAEHGQAVRLWVDDPAAFAALCPQADPALDMQICDGVEVRRWANPWPPVEPAEVVIEAFACELPTGYRQAMREQDGRRLWLNLEYLSAEGWVADCHGLPSMQADGLRKFFFFPGFDARTGGLLRERDLLAQRDAWQADENAQRTFLAGLGVQRQSDEQLISLFCYEHEALGEWLDALADATPPVRLLVPQGRVLGDLFAWTGRALAVGDEFRRGALSVLVLPFVSQPDYDRLLWSCDFNLVRGEDSLLRGLWAGRPFAWDIYKQAEGAHFDKLEAFLGRYSEGQGEPAAQALAEFMWAWNRRQAVAEAWRKLRAVQPEASNWAAHRAREMAAQSDLAVRLVQFCTEWL